MTEGALVGSPSAIGESDGFDVVGDIVGSIDGEVVGSGVIQNNP